MISGIAPIIKSLTLRIATLEARDPLVGPHGQTGEKGERGADGIGKDGAGVAGLVISAEGRLVAHLTDGRSIDAGPIPVKEGAPGRDADLSKILSLEAEVAALRVELAAQQAAPALDEILSTVQTAVVLEVGKIPTPKDGKDADLAIVKQFVVEQVATIPVPRDGKDVDPAEVAALVQTEVGKAVAAIPVPKNGVDGTSVSLDDVRPLVASAVEKAIAEIPRPKDGEKGDPGIPGQDGKSVELDDVAPLIAAEVQKAVAVIPVPKEGAPGAKGQDGTSVSVDDVAPLILSEVQKAVAAIPPAKDGAPGQDGSSVSVDDVVPVISAEVAKAVAAIPVPKDGAPGERGDAGRGVTVEDVAPLIVAEVTKAVAAIPVPQDGKDGVGLCGAIIDREGRLALTLSDGSVKHLGTIVGRDGHDVDMAAIANLVSNELATWARPKDGKDGFGFDDLDVVTDQRGIFVVFTRGDEKKEFRLAMPYYKNVWTSGTAYNKGDSVTYDGCVWIAKEDTSAKPEYAPNKPWQMATKKGRDGKDGKEGIAGKDGAPGRPGRDHTQRSPDGRTWS